MTLRLAGPLLLVGAGKMGGALLEGWLQQGLEPAHVFVRDPNPPLEIASLIARHGIGTEARAELPAKLSVILLAVKPQIVDAVLPSVAPVIEKETVVLSIVAGRTLASLARYLPKGAAIVRAMLWRLPRKVSRGTLPRAIGRYQQILAPSRPGHHPASGTTSNARGCDCYALRRLIR